MAANREEGGGRVATVPPNETESELKLVKRYLLLGIVMRILDHDIRVIGASGMKLPRFYETLLRGIGDRVLLDMADMRRTFRQQGIKIYEEKREKDGLHAQYVCRGYHHRFFMLWGFVKAESELVLKEYMSGAAS